MRYFIKDISDEKLREIIAPSSDIICVKKGKCPKKYLKLYCGFDIETTNIPETKHAYMYIWQFSFNDNVLFGRTWNEFIYLIDKIKKYNNLSKSVHIIVWIANMNFEFSFINSYLNITRIFAKEKRKPLYFEVDECIEFREALTISGGSLEYLANTFTTTKKLVGDLDYSIPRNNETILSEKELDYCENDVLILSEWSEYIFNNFIIPNKYVPLTKTGILRRKVKDNISTNIKDIIQYCYPNEEMYEIMMKYLFRGGYVHANAYHVDVILYNVDSVDITSSYPDRMLNAYYPMKFFHTGYNKDNFENELENKCCMILVEFYDLKPLTNHSIESISKTVNNVLKEDIIVDNGRIRQCSKVVVWLTELDFKIYKKYYSWSNMCVLDMYTSDRYPLPNYLLDVLQQEYIIKSNLKRNKKGNTKEYYVAKQNVNSAYGMCVTRHVTSEITFENGTWLEDKSCYDFNSEVDKSFLLPQWGVWITAQARYKILSMIKRIIDNSENYIDDVIYCDTDSIKLRNYEKHKDIINEYNGYRMVSNDSKFTSEFHDIGCFEHETKNKIYKRFKTLGSKRYIYEDSEGYHITIAGLPKKSKETILQKCKNENIDFFDYFKNNMELDCEYSNKLTTKYNDEPHEEYVNGVLMHENSSVCLYEIPFKITMLDIYVTLVEELKKESKYEERIY